MSEFRYLSTLCEIIELGTKKKIYGHDDRYILSLFGALIKFDLSESFPILTTKKVFYNGAFKEMLWFIEGTDDVVTLHKQGVKIWDDWGCKYHNKKNATNYTLEQYQKLIDDEVVLKEVIPLHYSNSTNWKYLKLRKEVEIVEKDDNISLIYADTCYLDQTKWVIDEIQKNPDRKSYLVSNWRPDEVYHMADECDNESVVLPACHTHYSLNVSDSSLSMMLYMRSLDYCLGAPFNIAQYALLLRMYAHCTGFKPGKLVIAAADLHLYSNQIEAVKEQLTREPFDFPTLTIRDRGQKYLQDFVFEDFEVLNYKSHGTIKAEITVVGGYE